MFVLCPCLFRELHSAQHIKILSLISNLRLQLAGLVLVVHVESQDSSILTSTAMKEQYYFNDYDCDNKFECFARLLEVSHILFC